MATGTWGNNCKCVEKKNRNLQIDTVDIHAKTKTQNGCFDDSDSKYEVSIESSAINIIEHFEFEAICLIAQVGISYSVFP